MLELKSDNKGTWFHFDPDDPSKGGVRLRELTTEEHLRIEKLTVTVKRKIRRGAWVEDKKTDERLAAKLRWQFIVVEWKGVSIDGNEVECTQDNIARAMKITDFVKIIIENLEELTEDNATLKEARVKNSQSTSSGNSARSTVESA